MRLKRWEVVVGILGIGFAALFLFSNVAGLGFALLAADVLWVITRIEILEDHNNPGHYTTLRGRLGVLGATTHWFLPVGDRPRGNGDSWSR